MCEQYAASKMNSLITTRQRALLALQEPPTGLPHNSHSKSMKGTQGNKYNVMHGRSSYGSFLVELNTMATQLKKWQR